MSAGTVPRNPVARAIKAILLIQLGMAAFLFGQDILEALPRMGFGPRSPALDGPVRPGDQTRRYNPREMPRRDAAPGSRPFPATTDMPDRLQFNVAETDDGPVLTVTGAIQPGDAKRFETYLESIQDLPLNLFLNSPGGSVADALLIGRRVRDEGFETRMAAGDICMSACPYVFSAGVTREAADGSFIGVHQHYFEENTALPAFIVVNDIQRGQGEVMRYLDEMGVDPLLMQHALVTPPEDIYVFVRDELERYDIVTDGPSEG